MMRGGGGPASNCNSQTKGGLSCGLAGGSNRHTRRMPPGSHASPATKRTTEANAATPVRDGILRFTRGVLNSNGALPAKKGNSSETRAAKT